MPREMRKNGGYGRKSASRERAVAELVARQHGVIARWQLVGLGVSGEMVRRRVEGGRLYLVQPVVYSLIPDVSVRGRMMAAVLTFGADAVLSHRAAAAVWDLGPWPTGAIDVTVNGRRDGRRGLRLHHTRVERVVKDGFPVTPVARTLVDMASVLSLGRLRDAFEQAERLGLLDVHSVNEQMHGRRGAKKIRAILADWTEPEPTRGELEKAFRALCKQAALPPPSCNVSVRGYEVDAYWPEMNLVVELDSWEWHRTRRAFEDDRLRSAVLEAADVRVLRFTWRQVKREPDLLVRAIRRPRPAGS